MDKITIVSLLTGGYFGFSLGHFANVHWDMWQFYAILIPVTIGFNILYWLAKEEN